MEHGIMAFIRKALNIFLEKKLKLRFVLSQLFYIFGYQNIK
jgi:hypothetical protein